MEELSSEIKKLSSLKTSNSSYEKFIKNYYEKLQVAKDFSSTEDFINDEIKRIEELFIKPLETKIISGGMLINSFDISKYTKLAFDYLKQGMDLEIEKFVKQAQIEYQDYRKTVSSVELEEIKTSVIFYLEKGVGFLLYQTYLKKQLKIIQEPKQVEEERQINRADKTSKELDIIHEIVKSKSKKYDNTNANPYPSILGENEMENKRNELENKNSYREEIIEFLKSDLKERFEEWSEKLSNPLATEEQFLQKEINLCKSGMQGCEQLNNKHHHGQPSIIESEYTYHKTKLEIAENRLNEINNVSKKNDENKSNTAIPNVKKEQKKLELKDFFKSTNEYVITELIIKEIQSYAEGFIGKKMTIVIYLLQSYFKIITITNNSRTNSREHFVTALHLSKLSMQAINKHFNAGTNDIKIDKTGDGDYIQIKENLTKLIPKAVV